MVCHAELRGIASRGTGVGQVPPLSFMTTSEMLLNKSVQKYWGGMCAQYNVQLKFATTLTH
jgi:hypothetical protein